MRLGPGWIRAKRILRFKGAGEQLGNVGRRSRTALARTDASERLTNLFQSAGSSSLTERAVEGSKQPNLVCRTVTSEAVGRTKIVAGAPFDSAGFWICLRGGGERGLLAFRVSLDVLPPPRGQIF